MQTIWNVKMFKIFFFEFNKPVLAALNVTTRIDEWKSIILINNRPVVETNRQTHTRVGHVKEIL